MENNDESKISNNNNIENNDDQKIDIDTIEDIQCIKCFRDFKYNKITDNVDYVCYVCLNETPIVKNNYHIIQKYIFIIFVLGLNLGIAYLWYIYTSIYWVILIVIPRIRDILLTICISLYNILFCKCFRTVREEGASKNISINIFCYCEQYELIIKNLDAITENYKGSNDKYVIALAFDGAIIGKKNNDTLFNTFSKDERFTHFTT